MHPEKAAVHETEGWQHALFTQHNQQYSKKITRATTPLVKRNKQSKV